MDCIYCCFLKSCFNTSPQGDFLFHKISSGGQRFYMGYLVYVRILILGEFLRNYVKHILRELKWLAAFIACLQTWCWEPAHSSLRCSHQDFLPLKLKLNRGTASQLFSCLLSYVFVVMVVLWFVQNGAVESSDYLARLNFIPGNMI